MTDTECSHSVTDCTWTQSTVSAVITGNGTLRSCTRTQQKKKWEWGERKPHFSYSKSPKYDPHYMAATAIMSVMLTWTVHIVCHS